MSLLYYGSLSSFNGDTWKAELRDASSVITTGTELTLTGDGILFKYDGDGDEFYTSPLRESSVSVFFNVDNTTDETFFENLSLQNEGDYAIIIYKNNNLYWIGRILPDILDYERKPLVNTTFEVVATDTLSFLDQYNIEQSWFTNNKITGIDLITEILKVSGLDTFWSQIGASNFIADAIFTYNQTSGSSYHLANYEFDYLSFYKELSSITNQVYPDFKVDINCKDALNNILTIFNARMFLTDGMYHIVQPQSYSAGSSIVYDIYDTSGTLTSSNSSFPHEVQIATTNERPQWNDFPTITAQPAIRELSAVLSKPLAFKYSFRDYASSKSTSQMSVDDFEFNVGGGDIRVLANFQIDASNVTQNLGNPNYSEIKIKYRVFAWNGTSAYFWDWEENKFSEPNPPNNGWRYKSVATPVQKNYNRLVYNAEFDQTYTSAVGVSGSLSGYTIYAEFEIYYHLKLWNNAYLALPFGGYVRIIQEKLFPVEVKTTNTSLSPLASKKENITLKYWDTEFDESVYRINVNNGTSFVEPGNWVSFNSYIGTLSEVFSNNLMSMYGKAVPVIQGNWIDNGSYDIKKSIVFDSKKWLFNGGSYSTYLDAYEGEWLCIDDDDTGITVGSEGDIQDGNNQEDLQLQVGKQVWNDTGESLTDYSENLSYDIMDKSDDSPTTAPSQITEFGVKISYNPTDDVLNWNVAELGKAVTITSDETVTDTSVQIFDVDTALGSINLTLPTPSDVKGREYIVKKSHPANTVTVTGTIDGSGSYLLDYENESIVLISNGLEYVVKSEYGKDDLTDVTNRNNTTENTVGVGALQLDLTPSATPTAGMLYWDEDEETAAIQVNGLNYEIGQGLYWVAKNQTGSTITKGTAVYASGTLGTSGRILISPMIANGTIEAKYFLGITAEDIANGDDGKVITQGKVRQIDTSGYTAGDVLWVSSSTAGALTSTQPTGSNLALAVAFVVESATNGVMAVRVSVLDENAIGGTTPTLDEVTTAGNTTTNDIEVGGLNVDSGTLYVDSTNNRVGIGSTSPDKKLHIEDATRMDIKFEMTGSTVSDHYIRKDGRYLRFRGQDDSTVILELRNNSDGNQVVMPSGNVLIGSSTDDGSNKLQVTGNAIFKNTSMEMTLQDSNSAYPTSNAKINFADNGTLGTMGFVGYNFDGHLTLQQNNPSKYIVLNGSNVGIGTSSPSQKLSLSGGHFLLDNNYEIRQKDSGGTERTIIELDSSNNFNIGGSYSGATKFIGGGSYTERMRVHTNGNVGIGTTNPNFKLEVDGGIKVGSNAGTNLDFSNAGLIIKGNAAGNNSYMIFEQQGVANWRIGNRASTGNFDILSGGAGTERLTITTGGLVGIGTTSPSRPISVQGSSTSIIAEFKYTAAGYSSIDIANTVGVARLSSVNNDLLLSPGSAEKMRVKSNGNVLIGTTTDSGYKLDVNGTIKGTHIYGETYRSGRTDGDIYIQAATATDFVSIGTQVAQNLLRVQGDGNVGISNTSPSYKLDVTGDINATSNYYHNGVQGYTGTVTIQQPAPNPPINIDINGGIITNVY